MTSTALSKRYPVFISAFEALVTEAQKRIEEARGAEAVYNIVREALIETDCGLDLRLTISGNDINLAGSIPPTYDSREFDKILKAIHRKAIARGMRSKDDDPPELSPGGYSCQLRTSFIMSGKRSPKGIRPILGWVNINLDLNSSEGCVDWEVTKETRTNTFTYHVITKRSPHGRHAHSR